MNIYGRVVTGTHVRNATEASLKLWVPGALGEVAVQSGRGRCDLKGFKSWTATTSVDNWVEDQLPACVVVSPGLLSTPERFSDGTYDAEWSVGVGVIVAGPTREATTELLELYVAAVRMAVLQQPSLAAWDGTEFTPFAEHTRWIDESYDELDFNDSRTIAAGMVSFGVRVASVVDGSGGPVVPPTDPCTDPASWGIVTSTPLTTKESA